MMMTSAVSYGSWVQAGVVIFFNLLTAAFTYGAVVQKQKEHERRLNENDKQHEKIAEEQDSQWQSIGHTQRDLAELKGKMNGA